MILHDEPDNDIDIDPACRPPTASGTVRPVVPLGRRFLIVWIGQTISEVGTTLSGIAAAVYVFIQTGSTAWLGLLAAITALPFVLAMPLAPMIDRRSRRHVMIGADVLAAVGPVCALLLLLTGRLEAWHLALTGFVGGIGNAFQIPASQAAVPALVHRDALDRANALRQLGPGIGLVAGPALATPILARWGIEAILLIDLLTFVVGVTSVAAVKFDDHRDDQPITDDRTWSSMWTWLSRDGRPLIGLLAAASSINFVLAMFNVSIIALSVAIVGVADAGVVLGIGGAAMIAGAIALGRRGLPDDRVGLLARAVVIMGIGLAIAAARPDATVLTLGVVVGFAAVPAANAAIATIFHERVPASMQGRVFALRGATSSALQPLGSIVAGVLVARVAAPSMAEGGALADSIGAVIGRGPERGAAVLLLACSLALIAIGAAVARTGLRRSLGAIADGEPAPLDGAPVTVEPVQAR